MNELVMVGLELGVELSLSKGKCEGWPCASITLDYTLQYVEGRAVFGMFFVCAIVTFAVLEMPPLTVRILAQ